MTIWEWPLGIDRGVFRDQLRGGGESRILKVFLPFLDLFHKIKSIQGGGGAPPTPMGIDINI